MPEKSDLTQRGFLLALGLALAASMGQALDAHALGGLNTVTLSPAHGKVTASFQATYSISPCQGASGLTIGFSWNALPTAGPVLGTAVTDASCRAILTAKPPANAAPASYLVYGYVQLPTGGATPNTEASASYTVDVAPTATATATARATSSTRASTSATASSTASASASVSATSTAQTPAASNQPQPSASASSTGGSGRVGTRTPSHPWWTTLGGILAIVGGLLLAALLIAALFLLLPVLRRRSRSAVAPAKDRAA